MSMNGHFVEIKPRLLTRLQQEPSLVATVVYPELADKAPPSDSDVDAMIRSWSPAQQQYFRAVQSADADAIVAALKTLVPRKQWLLMQTHICSTTKEQLLQEAAESKERLAEVARGFQSILGRAAEENAGGQSIPDGDLGARLCIDKAWDGLDHLLCSAMDTYRGPLDLAVLGGREIGDDYGYGPARYLDAWEVRAVAAALSTVTRDTLRQHYDAVAMNEAEVYPGRWDDPPNGDNLDWLLQAFDEVSRFYQGATDHRNAVIKSLR
jgi:hypothetical protein